MTTTQKSIAGQLKRKFHSFELKGLLSYFSYLEDQVENAKGKRHKQAYLRYNQEELKRVKNRIAKLKLE